MVRAGRWALGAYVATLSLACLGCATAEVDLRDLPGIHAARSWAVTFRDDRRIEIENVPSDSGLREQVVFDARTSREHVARDLVEYGLMKHSSSRFVDRPSSAEGLIALNFVEAPLFGGFREIQIFLTDPSGRKIFGVIEVHPGGKSDSHAVEKVVEEILEVLERGSHDGE